MNKKVEKYFLTSAIVLLVSCAYLWMSSIVNKSILTDSGFDYSYDSGSSSGGGGSSGSSWSSSDSGHSSSSDDDEEFGLFDVIIIIMMVAPIVVFLVYAKNSNESGGLFLNRNMSKNEEDIQKIIPSFDLNKFITDRYNDFVKIQNAWSEFNYDELKEVLTDELYNQYLMQLKTLETKQEKNVMHSFKKNDMMITSVKEVNNRYEIKVELIVSFYDYIECNGEVVRGDRDREVHVFYELLFVSSSDEVISKCPTCGAELGDNNTEKCPYCHNVINRLPDKWLLSKKEIVSQR